MKLKFSNSFLLLFLRNMLITFSGLHQHQKEIKNRKRPFLLAKPLNYKGEKEMLLLDIYSLLEISCNQTSITVDARRAGFCPNYD